MCSNKTSLPFGFVEKSDSAENDKGAVVVGGGKGVANVVFEVAFDDALILVGGGGVDFGPEDPLIEGFIIGTSG